MDFWRIVCATYHELDEGADDVDGVGGEEGVGEEAAEEREQERGAHEVGDRGGRLRRRVVHEPHQVRHQVARVRQERQVLQHLHHCTPCQPAQFSSALAPSRMHDDPTILLQANPFETTWE